MLVNIEAKLAFLAQTKCGSTSIESALRPHSHIIYSGHHRVTHMHAMRFKRFIRSYLDAVGIDGVEITCMIRHPQAWLESWWRYRSQPGRWDAELETTGISFEQFVNEYIDEENKAYVDLWTQAKFMSGQKKQLLVDHVFRFEELDVFHAFWEERLGKSIDITHQNKSPERKAELSASTQRRLEIYLARDYEIWESETVGHK